MENKITYTEKHVFNTFKYLPSIREQVFYTSNFSLIDTLIDMEILLEKSKLTPYQYEIFLLYYIEGYTLQEIANMYGHYNHNTPRDTIKRIKKKISKVLDSWGDV
ncbi:RNA polymerase sigma factor [[Clostridium] sordellii]|jgi:DNA-directed RNA polymerase specialized sigma24 family protein|uniref:sigma factor-like helix-turn-helix DNA-binding protein n=1 Tax=Paraclostridium sordellii TaxID=1505 RepID=UPI0005DBADFF|nr:sigma factor-like helix-turn-helix DNA-binding protein [Paeniclostridium sordellii]CEN30862.1 RNA polymerase sigma factor [[Clostridium] sordellii] [Paeniclostridium sordellii]